MSLSDLTRFLPKVDPHYHRYFFLTVFTGMRPGEQIALKWDDVDFPGGTKSVQMLRKGDRGVSKDRFKLPGYRVPPFPA